MQYNHCNLFYLYSFCRDKDYGDSMHTFGMEWDDNEITYEIKYITISIEQ